MREILKARDLYSLEPASLASFDFDKVKILHRDLNIRPLRGELPPAARGYLQNFREFIEKTEEELEVERAEGQSFVPYWDPRLRASRRERLRLYQRLQKQGLLSFRRKVKALAALFVVKKKDGMQRLIVDARQACAAHRPPPLTRLGSVRCMAELDLSDPRLRSSGFGELAPPAPFGQEGDVGDCFYNFSIPELGSWFGLDDPMDTSELQQAGLLPSFIWDDSVEGLTPVREGEVLYPVVEALCMGWSWALFFANEAVAWRVSRTGPGDGSDALRERQPVPDIRPGHTISGTYVDSVQVIGGCRADVLQRMDLISDSFASARIPFLVTDGDETSLATLGVVYHWKERRLRHVPRRLWRTALAGQALLKRRKLLGHSLEVWLGHAVNLF